jgi:deazaflavin-dependent oxidoreductase (nitroreductase family)
MLGSAANEDYCYLSTRERVTGEVHTIEIWFVARGATVYMLSGGRERSDWVKNLIAHPQVRVRIGDEDHEGTARVVETAEEDAWVRDALVEKYEGAYSGDLEGWRQRALPIAVDLEVP